MRYRSTRGAAPKVTLSEAIARGLAPDGGLYVPTRFPLRDPEEMLGQEGLAEIGTALLTPFFAGDALDRDLGPICREAFNFPAPLRYLARETAVLELFHGPTAAFKDFGARFLAATLARLEAGRREEEGPTTVLVATSGDTGGAVAAAFHGKPGIEVVVLYPKGMVSARQEKQLTAWGGNVRALRVRGDFDACQRLVKEAFADGSIRSRRRLTSANSINLGRLLPQMVYYAAASLEYQAKTGSEPGFIVPSGNLGNAVACLWAREVGMPIREVVLATNANPAITRFLDTGEWEPRPTIATLASAMDVGAASNFERLLDLFGDAARARRVVRAYAVFDDEVRERIRRGPTDWGQVWDPHTATAAAVRERVEGSHWVLVATAHPAKFESIVEPLVGREIPIPTELQRLLSRPQVFEEIEPDLEELRTRL